MTSTTRSAKKTSTKPARKPSTRTAPKPAAKAPQPAAPPLRAVPPPVAAKPPKAPAEMVAHFEKIHAEFVAEGETFGAAETAKLIASLRESMKPKPAPANPIAHILDEMTKRPLRAENRSPTEQRAELVTLRHHDGTPWQFTDAAPLGLLAAMGGGADTTRNIAEDALEALAVSLSILDSAVDDEGGRGGIDPELVCQHLQHLARQARVAADLSQRMRAADEYRKTAECGLVPAIEGSSTKAVA